MKFQLGMLVCLGLMVLVSTPSVGQTNYLEKYSGAYVIAPDDGSEAYALASNGKATWIWKHGSGVDKKYGTWIARSGFIKISINGKSGLIEEVYILKNGKFVNQDDRNRYLIKQ